MIAAALYRAALRLGPRAFRREYAASMACDFDQYYEEEQTRYGHVAAWRYAAGAIADTIAASLGERWSMMWSDVAFSARTLAKTPLFTLIVALTLALGIGANAAVFSVIDAVLLKPLPYPDAGRLVMIWGHDVRQPTGSRMTLSYENAMDLRRMTPQLASLAVFTADSGQVTVGSQEPYRYRGGATSAAFFDVLKTRAALGRTFEPRDERPGAPRVTVVSDGFWRSHLDADPSAIGRTILVNDRPTTVIGVLPPAFLTPSKRHFGNWGDELFTCLRPTTKYRGAQYLAAVARLRDGVTLAQVQSQFDVASAHLQQVYRNDDAGLTAQVYPLQDELVGGTRPVLTIILFSVLGLLLVACANVANLLLARAATRERELAIRVAVGASRRRIVAQLLTESTLLSTLGAALGVLLAAVAVRAFAALGPPDVPRLDTVRVDGAVLAFTAIVTALTAIGAGLMPALTLSRPDLIEALKEGDRTGSQSAGHALRDALVVAEVALALALVVTSGLLVRSFVALTTADVGFRTNGLVAIRASGLTLRRYPTQAAKAAFYHRALSELSATPWVRSAALAVTVPIVSDEQLSYSFAVVGRPRPRPGFDLDTAFQAVSPDYFRTLGIGALGGRVFTADDRIDTRPVVIVDQTFVDRFFPHEDPLGKQIAFTGSDNAKRTIVGVVPPIHTYSLSEPDRPMLYEPLDQCQNADTTDGLVRTDTTAAAVTPGIVAAYRAAAPSLPRPEVESFAAGIARKTARERAGATLLSALAMIGLLLALAGIYGVVSYNVAQRTHEIGIRMALGALPRDVLNQVLAAGLRLTVLGIVLGIALAALCARGLWSSQLYGVGPYDAPTYAMVSLVLVACAIVALLVPALRATRVDPNVALRYE